MKQVETQVTQSSTVVGDIRDSLSRPLGYMTDVAMYIAYLLVRAGLEPAFAKVIVIRIHTRWGYSSDFMQGIRICAADDSDNSLELSVLVRKETPIQATLTYHPKPGERWVATELRRRLVDAVGGTRFRINDGNLKEFKRLGGKLSVPSRAVAAASKDSVLTPTVTAYKPAENGHELLDDPTPQAVAGSVIDGPAALQEQEIQELPKNDRYGHGTNRVSLKNPVCEQTVCLEFATNELGKDGKLFGSKAAYQLIEKALGVTLTEGETRGLMKGMVSRGYLQSIGSDPARYQVLPALYTYVNSAFPGCGDQLTSLSEKTPPTPAIEPSPLSVVKAEKQTQPVTINPHEAKLAELSASIAAMESAKTEGEKLESELRAMRRAESVKATLSAEVQRLREIAQSLQVRLAEAEQNLEKKQLELADAESDSKLIAATEERLLELQHQYASLPAALEKRKKLAEALEKYSEATRMLAELDS